MGLIKDLTIYVIMKKNFFTPIHALWYVIMINSSFEIMAHCFCSYLQEICQKMVLLEEKGNQFCTVIR